MVHSDSALRENMKHTPSKTLLPKLPKNLLPETPDLEPESTYSGLKIELDTSGTEIYGLTFQGVHFEDSNFSGTRWEWLRLQDVLLEHCNLAGLNWLEAGFTRVKFQDCRLLGAQFVGLQAAHLTLQNCDARLSFWQGNFKQAHFKDCNFEDARFDTADLQKAVFRDCNLTRANLRECKLQETDFRGSVLAGFKVQVQNLQGAIIETQQLPELAYLLGIQIQEGIAGE